MCSPNKNTTTQTTSANPAAMAAYSSVIPTIQGIGQTPYQPYTGQLVSPISQEQVAGIGNTNQYATYAVPYVNTAETMAQSAAQPITAADINQYVNPYTQAVVNATQAQFANQNAQQQEQVQGNAISQGAMGGNREAIAASELANQQQLAQAPVIAGLESQGYTQGVNTALTEQQALASGAYSVGSLGVAGQNAALTGAAQQFGLGSQTQATQQAADTARYQQYLAQLEYPYQTTGWEASQLGGLGSLMGGTSQTVGPPPNVLSQIGGLGTLATGLGGQAGLFSALGLSDRRAKENIRKIGKLFDGQTIYRFNYKGDPETRIGLIAQEVQKHHPDAIREIGGLKHVDYDRATEDAIRRARGGVANHYYDGHVPGFAPGGGVAMPYTFSPTAGSLPYPMRLPSAGSMPYSGGVGYVPSSQPVHGHGPPGYPPNLGAQGQPNIAQQAKGIGQLGQQIQLGLNQPTNINPPGSTFNPSPAGTIVPVPEGVAPPPSSGDAIYHRGGSVGRYASGGIANLPAHNRIMMPRGYADGGGDSALPDWANDASIVVPPPTNGVATPFDTPAIPPDSVPLPPPRPSDAAITEAAYTAPEPEGINPMPSMTSSGNLPRGLRNNNPLNIENGEFASGQPGYTGPEAKGRFATFASPEAGYNAASNLLSTYGQKGINTVSGVVSRWAPASDNNDTHAYAGFVAAQLGVDPNQPLDMNDPNVRSHLAMAMSKYENGTGGGGNALAYTGNNGVANAPGVSAINSAVPLDIGNVSVSAPQPQGVAPGIDFSASSKLWPALITAGGAMLASRSPFPGVALGEGAVAGAQAYSNERAQQQQEKFKQAEVDLQAKRLQQEAEIAGKRLDVETRPYSEMTQYQKRETDIKAQEADALNRWRMRMNLKPSGRETVDGHPISTDAYSGQSIDTITGQPVDNNVQTRPAKGNYRPAGIETEDGHPLVYDTNHPGSPAVDAVTGASVAPGTQTRPAHHTAGAIEGIADRLMDENQRQRVADPTVPEMSFQEALVLAHKAPNADQDTIRRLNLASGAWKAWTSNPANMGKKDAPEASLDYWNNYYGVTPNAPPAGTHPAAAPNHAAAPPAFTPPTRPSNVPADAVLQKKLVNGQWSARWRTPDGTIYSADGTRQ